MSEPKHANRLINSTSPYLLQHAYNPVDWFEWGDEALQKAKKENKPILVSIGYSSCHWCHVMEREVFEKENFAKLMNEYLVCIKVDREERPDVDQVYMDAVQAMGIHGGWPLNVFLTPDQKPFYGGTYFPPQQWVQVLQGVHRAFNERRNEIDESASELAAHLARQDTTRLKKHSEQQELSKEIEITFSKLEEAFDKTWGGLDKAPKFVMPSVWLWLLRYYHVTKNGRALSHIRLTLNKIMMGGIYDQIGGGFARYSVDGQWFAPHFEKMLYDNAQLFSLYSEAYSVTSDPAYKTILDETFEWLQAEMMHPDGGFYSALDADSEGVEGKFYIWRKSEIEAALGSDSKFFIDYYSITDAGNWEHGSNILFRKESDDVFLSRIGLSNEEWKIKLRNAKDRLLAVRDKRIKPGLDDKIITSWNAMTVSGLADAYKATADEKFLKAATRNMMFLERELAEGAILFRSFKNKRSIIHGFLDDYAYLIHACIRLYEVTFEEYWIKRAQLFLEYTIDHYLDSADGFFNYSGKNAEKLIASRKEIFDNVIPASNSVMAQNLFRLGTILDNDHWKKMATDMTSSLSHLIVSEPNFMSNWGIAYLELKKGLAEVAFVGEGYQKLRDEFNRKFEPFATTMGASAKSDLPLLAGKEALLNKTTIYVCYDKACQKPVHSVNEALAQLR